MLDESSGKRVKAERNFEKGKHLLKNQNFCYKKNNFPKKGEITMKKLFALVLALIMVLSLGVSAFAATGTNADTGSITVDKAHTGFTYSIYQILVLESYDTSINSYIYKPAPGWEAFVETCGYLVLNSNGTVKWNGTATQTSAAAFAKDALAYAESNSIAPYASMKKDTDDTVVKFENLNLGYWLVDSSVGAVCSLDTVMPDTIIEEKNLIPEPDKKVEDHEGNMQESTTARIGEKVKFATKITLHPGTENLVYHDRMQSTLDYLGVEAVYYTPMANGNLVDPSNYTVVESGLEDDCTFEVRFSNDFLATITHTTDITVVYYGALNETAIIGNPGNLNEAKITYGDEGESEWDEAKVYTYKFGIVKTDISNHILEGAEFELYYSETGDDKIPLVEEKPADAIEGINYYRPATEEEEAAAGFTSAVIKAGKACIWGVRSGIDMYLDEIKAPEGYNPIEGRFHIPALTDNNLPVFTAEGLYEKGGVEVENLAGAQLPQTGGIGTTIFYIVGGMLFVGALVFLVTKKRMSE